jgi:hypothetical protein
MTLPPVVAYIIASRVSQPVYFFLVSKFDNKCQLSYRFCSHIICLSLSYGIL